ncbi:MAG: radical SAM protein [Candidatus Omnitrophica bacterium]|nr:radical SAM protein [Candidatus Omnitrophota bacterium]MDD5352609.1 radical SAM protein [Candidatus Omnitrophota bacterium]MDD5550207.1 radical SAM protein [Candidatus Omnitrophota bacterium]
MPVISIYNRCNNKCIMCTNPDKFWNGNKKEFNLSFLLNRLDRFYQGEKEFLEIHRDSFSFTGGEPTLSPYLIPLIEKINALFYGKRVICLTNGRMFSYADYAKRILQLGINLELAIAIHGHNSKIHDSITRTAKSFVQTTKGLHNIFRFKKKNHTIEIRVVMHQLNYKFLEKITRFIKKEFPSIDRLVFIFFEIEGQACKNIKAIKVTYSQLLPYIEKIRTFLHYFPEVRFYHFPLCVLPTKFYPYVWRTLPDREVSFLNNCRGCNLKQFCLGVHKGYLKYVGDSEFKPIKRKINIQEGCNWHHPILKVNP